jgi:hypothetical protein
MGLNMKDEGTRRLELAAATGETQTMAVTAAVRERICGQQHEGLPDLVPAIGRGVAGRVPDASQRLSTATCCTTKGFAVQRAAPGRPWRH